MNRILQTMRYLTKSIINPTLFALVVTVAMVAISDFTFFNTGQFSLTKSQSALTMPLELTSGCFSLLIGAVIFLGNFRVSLANGISRRTFMLANLPVAMLLAAIFSIATIVITKVHNLFWPINTLSEGIMIENPNLNNAWPMIFQFSLYLFLILGGRFITSVYYRSNRWIRVILSLVPIMVFIFMLRATNGNQGVFPRVITSLFFYVIQPENIINFLILGSLVMFALTWLVIYRAPLKD